MSPWLRSRYTLKRSKEKDTFPTKHTHCHSIPSHLVFSFSLLRYCTYNMVGMDTSFANLDSVAFALVSLSTGGKTSLQHTCCSLLTSTYPLGAGRPLYALKPYRDMLIRILNRSGYLTLINHVAHWAMTFKSCFI